MVQKRKMIVIRMLTVTIKVTKNIHKHVKRQVHTWRRRRRNSQRPIAARIFAPTMHCHQSPVVQTLRRHISATPCKQYLSRATWRRQRQLHFSALWCTQCDDHLYVLQRTHHVTRGRTAVRLNHQVCRWIWPQTPSTNTPTCILAITNSTANR